MLSRLSASHHPLYQQLPNPFHMLYYSPQMFHQMPYQARSVIPTGGLTGLLRGDAYPSETDFLESDQGAGSRSSMVNTSSSSDSCWNSIKLISEFGSKESSSQYSNSSSIRSTMATTPSSLVMMSDINKCLLDRSTPFSLNPPGRSRHLAPRLLSDVLVSHLKSVLAQRGFQRAFHQLGILTLLLVSAKQYVVVHIRLHNIKGLNSYLIVHSYFQWQYLNGFGLVPDKAAHGHATRDKIILGLI
ncbi:hypothetical protein L3X38_045344 [Prunus dulcis]|uniref:Uncharacterized protein n=1 Tax=Prunus dulcis TaxID=3755 RepID=A0AAD4V1I7_PRUDU|nr:hypothetical protein L3X38_045344 [Prunus dulcis]